MNSTPDNVSDDTAVPKPKRAVGPVMQFSLLIVPMVMSAFFMVYALTGWILTGRDRLNWSLEAESVALWVGLSVLGYGLLTATYARWRGGERWHPLVVSGIGHGIVALLLMASVFITTRL